MKKEKIKQTKQSKNKSNIAVKIMALVLAGMMVLATVASLIYALIYA
jgi:hypothetical protein